MKRSTLIAAAAGFVAASTGVARAGGGCDGVSIGLSIGTAFRIGHRSHIWIGAGFPLWRSSWCDPYDGGWYDCGPRRYRSCYAPPRCDRGWSGGRYCAAEPVVVGAASIRLADRGTSRGEPGSARTADVQRASPAAVARATNPDTESAAWQALARGGDDAMERFGRVMARSTASGSAELGYAAAAAQAGQADRAAWAIRQAARNDRALGGVPKDTATRSAVTAALAGFESSATTRSARDHTVVVAALKAMAGDAEGAARAAESALAHGESAASVEALRRAIGVKSPSRLPSVPDTKLAAR